MPRVSALCDFLAEMFGLEPARVAGIAKALREEGLIKSGPRGINAPMATELDAAKILLGMMLRLRHEDVGKVVAWMSKSVASKTELVPFLRAHRLTLGEAIGLSILHAGEISDNDDDGPFSKAHFLLSIDRFHVLAEIRILHLKHGALFRPRIECENEKYLKAQIFSGFGEKPRVRSQQLRSICRFLNGLVTVPERVEISRARRKEAP